MNSVLPASLASQVVEALFAGQAASHLMAMAGTHVTPHCILLHTALQQCTRRISRICRISVRWFVRFVELARLAKFSRVSRISGLVRLVGLAGVVGIVGLVGVRLVG